MRTDAEAEAGRDALTAESVSATYEGRATLALSNVSLALRTGEIVVVLGPNGAGKTTLLRVLSGVQAVASGMIRLGGRPIGGLDRRTIARTVAVVRQAEPTTFGFSVREVVMMGRAPHQGGWLRPTADDERIVDEAIARLDISALADRPAKALSGGEARRVAIARAFAQAPQILMLDEPGAFLDIRHQLSLYDTLAREVHESKLACLVVMHDLQMAAQYADRVLLLADGELVAEGSPASVLTEARVHAVFGVRLASGVDAKTNTPYFVPARGNG